MACVDTSPPRRPYGKFYRRRVANFLITFKLITKITVISIFKCFIVIQTVNSEQSEYVKVIQSSGDALLTLISDILDFSKIEAGKLDLESRSFYLRDCVEGSIDLVAPLAAKKGIDISYSIHKEVPVSIIGDEARLRQIILNLVSNAVKFTEQGEVSVEVECVGQGGRGCFSLRISVRDTGMGIPLDKQKLLFQSFQQLQASTTRKFGGTGLGLTITKRLVELMGGNVIVKSEPGVGSIFTFTIETSVGDRTPRPFEAQVVPGLEDGRMLVVSDREPLCRVLAYESSRWGLSVEKVGSAGEALALVRTGSLFDVIIISADLGEASALGDSDELKRSDGSRISIIAVSRIDKSKSAVTSNCFSSFLQLPLKASALFERLREAAGSATPSGPTEGAVSTRGAQLASEIPLRILVAEDNPVNRKLVNLMLKKLGYKPDYAVNGKEAVELFFSTEQGYDLILMDVQMPELDGFEATQHTFRTNLNDSAG